MTMPQHPTDSSTLHHPIPPPIPTLACPPRGPLDTPRQPGESGPLTADYAPMQGGLTPHSLLEALLKKPLAVAFEITKGRRLPATLGLLVIAALCFLGYGAIIGSFSGGGQLLIVPLKVLIGVLFSALLCLPSLYIFSCFSGGRQSLGDTIGLFVLGLTLWSILLMGFAPIAWLFSQSTQTVAFMGLLHVLFWIAAACFGLSLMNTAFAEVNGRKLVILRAWAALFLIVTMQMATMLRPLVGPASSLQWTEKKFFLAHWGDCLDGMPPATH